MLTFVKSAQALWARSSNILEPVSPTSFLPPTLEGKRGHLLGSVGVEFVLGSSPLEEPKVRCEQTLQQVLVLEMGSGTYEQTTHPAADFTKRTTS